MTSFQNWLMVLGTWVMAVGSVIVAFLAVYGDTIRKRLLRPRVVVEPTGVPYLILWERPRYYLHVRLSNLGKVTARNCRVMLRGAAKKQLNGEFLPLLVPLPLQFTWSPSEMPPSFRDIAPSANDVIDLGFVDKGADTFKLQFYVTPSGQDHPIKPTDVVRYSLQVVADDYASPIQPFEAAWDGRWDDNPTTMRDYLTIRDVTQKHPQR
jgi:hypothetical protein